MMVEKQKKQLELEQKKQKQLELKHLKHKLKQLEQLELKHKKQLELKHKKSQYLVRKKWEKEMKNTLVTMSALAALAILIFFIIYQKIFLGTPFFGDGGHWFFYRLPVFLGSWAFFGALAFFKPKFFGVNPDRPSPLPGNKVFRAACNGFTEFCELFLEYNERHPFPY